MRGEIVLVGGGGHCRACIDVLELHGGFRIAGIIDVAAKLHDRVLGYEVIGTDDDLPKLCHEYENFLVTVGQIKSPMVRKSIFLRLKSLGASLPVIVSPLAHVSAHSQIGEGSMVMHQALINAGAVVGCNCIINSRALVEHDVILADHCHIATAAVLNGGVKVGEGTFVGSGTVVKEGVAIGEAVVVGCNATIKCSVPDGNHEA